MNAAFVYEIRVGSHLPERWSDWLEGLAIHLEADGKTTLQGPLPDQAALMGVLNRLTALNITILSVKRLETG